MNMDNINVGNRACARFEERLVKAGFSNVKGLGVSFASIVSEITSVKQARQCAQNIASILPQPPRVDIALEAISAFRGARNWAHFKASLIQPPKAASARQATSLVNADVLCLLVPASSRYNEVDWCYFHPAAQGADARRISVSIDDDWHGFYIDVSYVDGLSSYVLESVIENGFSERAEVMRKVHQISNRLAEKWMSPHTKVAMFSGKPDGIGVLEERGFAPHNTGGNVMCWLASHGDVECLISSMSNSLHVWTHEPVMVTVFVNGSREAWEDAETKEMSLAKALDEWNYIVQAAVVRKSHPKL